MGPAIRSRLALCVGVAASVLGSIPVRAAEVWKSQSEAWVFEGSGFYKPYGSWLILPRSLVEGTAAIASAEGAPTLAAPAQVGLSTNTLRLSSRLSWENRLDFTAAWQVAGIVASNPAFAAASSSNYLGASLIAPQRRLWDVPVFLASGNGLLLQENLDRLALKYAADKFSVTVGRQVLSWGTGHLWNPTDLVSPFAPTDVDREVRRGADAARFSLSLNATSQLEVLWLPQTKGSDNGGIVRGRTNIAGWDFSLTAAKYVTDLVLGGDFAGDLGPLGVHGEAAWTLPIVGLDESSPLGVELGFVRAVGGLDWRPSEKWIFGGEYYFNGFGAHGPAEIVAKLRDPREVRGEVFGAERHYAGLVATFLATELLTLNTTALVNLNDPSVTFVPALEYSFEQHVLLRAGGFIPLGRGVDVAALQRLTPANVYQSPLLSTLAARSEYGLSPFGVFVQVGVYVN